MNRKIGLTIAAVVLLAGGILAYELKPHLLAALLDRQEKRDLDLVALTNEKFLSSENFELKEEISKALEEAESKTDKNDFIQIGVISHHLPTALPLISRFYKNLADSAGPRGVFVILGPDHFEKCKSHVSTSQLPYLTPFGQLAVAEDISESVIRSGASVDEQCFEGEHSIAAQTIFIKYFFPEAKIVPIIFSANTTDLETAQVFGAIAAYQDRISIIGSVDFSHYQSAEQAAQIDRQSEEMTKNLSTELWDNRYVDSPAAIKLVILLAKQFNEKKAEILEHANSFDFTNIPENTTGYLSLVFAK